MYFFYQIETAAWSAVSKSANQIKEIICFILKPKKAYKTRKVTVCDANLICSLYKS